MTAAERRAIAWLVDAGVGFEFDFRGSPVQLPANLLRPLAYGHWKADPLRVGKPRSYAGMIRLTIDTGAAAPTRLEAAAQLLEQMDTMTLEQMCRLASRSMPAELAQALARRRRAPRSAAIEQLLT